LTTTVVENAEHLMPAQLDGGAARVLSELVTGLGLHVRCPARLAGVEPGPDGAAAAVRLADGSVLPARLVDFAAGVRARDDLAVGGLTRGDRGGFLVDEFCRTAVPGIWAAGDCAAVQGRCHGLVALGYRMAGSVARQLVGLPADHFDDGGQTVNLKLAGIRVVTVGQASPGAEDLEVAFGDSGGRYAKVVLAPSTGRVLGGILVGDTAATGTLRALVNVVVPDRVEQLLLPAAGDTDKGPAGGRQRPG
jgi:nitrite reductase (NADH) large subunit